MDLIDLKAPDLSYYVSVIETVIYAVNVQQDRLDTVYVSPNIKDILGYSVEEAMAQGWWLKHIHLDDRDRVIKSQAILMEHGVLTHHYRLRKKNGDYIWVQDKVRFLKNKTGQGGQIIGAWSDISRLKEMDTKLREREKLLRLSFETTPDALAITRFEDGVYVDVNQGFCHISGFSKKELLGKSSLDVQIWADPLDRTRLVEELNKKGTVKGFEARFRRKDGSEITGLMSASIFKSNGTRYILSITKDIEHIKRAQRELERRDRMLTDAQRVAHVGCWELDIQKNRLWWSDEIYRIFEIEKGDFESTYQAFLEVVHPEDRDLVHRAYTTSLSQKAPYHIEHRLLMPDGRIKWVEERCETSFSESGTPLRSIGTVLDITDRKLAHMTLSESEERFRHLFENSPVPLWEEEFTALIHYVDDLLKNHTTIDELHDFLSLHPHHLMECARRVKILDVNKAAIELHGAHSKEELLEGLEKIFTHRSLEVFKSEIVAIARREQHFESPAEVMTLGGEKRHVMVRFVWRILKEKAQPGKDPSYVAILATPDITGITKLKHRLQEKKEVLETLLEIERAILDTENPEEIAKEALYRLHRLIPAQRISLAILDREAETATVFAKGLLAESIGGGASIPVKNAFYDWDSLKRGEVVRVPDLSAVEIDTGVLALLKKSGIKSFFNVPLTSRGRPLGVLNFGFAHVNGFSQRDIEIAKELAYSLSLVLEQKRLVEALSKSEQELEKKVELRTLQLMNANKELEAFTYSVSHDLKAPLRAIEGFSRILKKDHASELGPEARRLLSIIVSNTQKMGQLIEDLLRLSKITKKELILAEVDMKGLAWAIFHELTQEKERAKIFFSLKSMPRAYADPSLMRHVYSNLISNAIKFSSRAPKPQIEAGAFEDEKGDTIYYVKDNGIGFDMAHGEKIFETFQRLHADEEYKGTGVGLSIVKRIIERHGGKVWAESTPGKGATFFFSLSRKAYIDDRQTCELHNLG